MHYQISSLVNFCREKSHISKDKKVSKDQYSSPLELEGSIVPSSSRSSSIFGSKKQLVQYRSPDHDLMVQYPPISLIRPSTRLSVQNKFKPLTYQQAATLPSSPKPKPASLYPNALTTVVIISSTSSQSRTLYVENFETLPICIIENEWL